jgi:hypothetical protein
MEPNARGTGPRLSRPPPPLPPGCSRHPDPAEAAHGMTLVPGASALATGGIHAGTKYPAA